ncbi:hypothetical protein SAMN06296036_102354 [Pseudobacteriovorax antillogorgiicola]|uniref:PilZ domain-containing protein n=2 Tax=Pseudobacteriovorax antillogorgiicola TaxID=1513793 RepID=A0A1Y6B908_9BACT|nr:hypothetical protein EDD56_10289 [Pseudobacteriovorax antillogorgiicola]SME97341.1 hypothetical protein SAMN06296036_102354 [Pseudobacteriovorax antillogorgiicola]
MDTTPRHSPWYSEEPSTYKTFPFHGKVRMIVPCEPWKLVLSLYGIEINKQWIRAGIDRKAFEKHFTFDDLAFIFRLDDRYGIQLEPEHDHLPTPLISGELSRRDVEGNGLQLQFTFLEPSQDLEELLAELESQHNYQELPKHFS